MEANSSDSPAPGHGTAACHGRNPGNIAQPAAGTDSFNGRICQPAVQHSLHQATDNTDCHSLGVKLQLHAESPSMLNSPSWPDNLNEAQYLVKSSHQAPATTIDPQQHQPQAFEGRVAAALESSSQIIANLTARLEYMVLIKSGASIQGIAACAAALDMWVPQSRCSGSFSGAYFVLCPWALVLNAFCM